MDYGNILVRAWLFVWTLAYRQLTGGAAAPASPATPDNLQPV